MTVEALEDLAMDGRPLPEDIEAHEKWLYLCLRLLHKEHRLGSISREQAGIEKKLLLKDFRQMAFQCKVGKHNTQMWKNIEAAANRFGKERSLECADAFFRAVYGLQGVGDFRSPRIEK